MVASSWVSSYLCFGVGVWPLHEQNQHQLTQHTKALINRLVGFCNYRNAFGLSSAFFYSTTTVIIMFATAVFHGHPGLLVLLWSSTVNPLFRKCTK